MTPARTAEGHSGRRLPRVNIDLAPDRTRILDDVAANPSSGAADVSRRVGLPVTTACMHLAALTAQGRLQRVRANGAWWYALPEVAIVPRPRPSKFAGIQKRVAMRRNAALQRAEMVAALLTRPRSIRWICAETTLPHRLVRHTIATLIRDGRVRNLDQGPIAGRYLLTPTTDRITVGV